MSPEASPTATPLTANAGFPCESEHGRQFLQDRLALFGKVLAVLALAFWAVNNLLNTTVNGTPWRGWLATPQNQAHLAGVAIAGLQWLSLRGRCHRAASLHAIDAISTIALGLCWTLAGTAMAPDPHHASHVLFATSTTLVARATLVPSLALRTLTLSALASLPAVAFCTWLWLTAAAPTHQSVLEVGGCATWAAASVALATIISRVTYGLQIEIREALQLGQYTLERKLGEGGMGEVYVASHAMLRRPVAIKLLPRDRAGDAALARFEREVQLTSQLTHPNTIAIYDYGRTPDGVFFYAMEYLDGVTLEQLVCSDGPQPPARVIHVLRQVCGALEEAHGVGLIHRDIKPANIMLCARGGLADVAKVLDFGLVKHLGQGVDASLSALNVVTGTPLYLSPEAIAAPDRVGPRTDLYALGAVGYYLLAGENVFPGRSTVEVCAHHLHTPPEPPSSRLGRPVPPDLEALILQCLAKDIAARPTDARTLRQALALCRHGDQWTEELAEAWWEAYATARRAVTAGTPAAAASREPTRSIRLSRVRDRSPRL